MFCLRRPWRLLLSAGICLAAVAGCAHAPRPPVATGTAVETGAPSLADQTDVVAPPAPIATAPADQTPAIAPLPPAEPRFSAYHRLEDALVRYRDLAALPWPGPLPAAPRRLDPGDRWAGVPVMAARLRLLGDLTAAPESAGADSVYAEPLVAAVRHFQARHAVAPDGVIGRSTLAHLDVPPARRVRQIEQSLARLRAQPDPDAGPLIVVNIPLFRLYAWADAAAAVPELDMKVIVGRADSLQTPVFTDRLRYVIFRPFWHPPRSIIVDEILPAMLKDPGYLDAHDMELCESAADLAPALPFDRANLERLVDATARVRQRPGPRNTLGLAKFMFPNRHKVYLHDTTSRGAFARARRDISHGCVRVQDPAALAEFVLRGEPGGWSPQRIRETMDGERTVQVNLTRRIPVWIIYLTAFAPADGEILFAEDIYGLDAAPAPASAGAFAR